MFWELIKKTFNPKRNIIKKIFIVLIVLAVFFSCLLFYFHINNIRRNDVSKRLPNWARVALAQVLQSYRTTVKTFADLPYLHYRFTPSNLPVYDIYIDSADLKKLSDSLSPPITNSAGTILADEYKNAKFKFNGKEYSVDIGYHGDMSKHQKANKKSWRIKFNKDDLFEGQTAIDLILPEDKDFYLDYIKIYRAKKLGLKTPKVDFVNLRFNGKTQGVYYLVEDWGQEIISDSQFSDLFNNGLLQEYVQDKKNIEAELKIYDDIYKNTQTAFYGDTKKSYTNRFYNYKVKYFRNAIKDDFEALSEALEDSSMLLKIVLNQNYDKGKRMPIRFDLDIMSYSPIRIRDIEFEPNDFTFYPDMLVYYDKDKNNRANYSDVLLGRLIYNTNEEKYHFKKLKDFDFYTNRLESVDETDQGGLVMDLVGLKKTDYRLLIISTNYNIPEIMKPEIKLVMESSTTGDEVKTKDRVFVNGNEFTYFDYKVMSRDDFLKIYPIFIRGAKSNQIILPAGSYRVTKNIIVPKGLELEIKAGTTMYFDKNISLISYSPVNAKGFANALIRFTALNSNKPWGVFGVVEATKKSEFKYTVFEYGGEDYINGIFFSGMLAAHSSDIKIENAQFKFATGDDGLNVKNAEAEVVNSLFYRNNFDALDFDFVKGRIANNKFLDSGNDGIDISGSNLLIEKNNIVDSGDKCISIGEKSKGTVSNNHLEGCNIGIAVKDLSEPIIVDNVIINNEVGISAYQKKQIFGGGFPKIGSNILENNKKDIETDKLSEIIEYK